MKLLSDVNFLLALVAEAHAHHQDVRGWWHEQPVDCVVAICRPVQTGLLRLLCTAAVLGKESLTLPQAWSVYAQLLASGRFAFALEPRGLDTAWEKLCRHFGQSPKVVMDAYLAAFAQAGHYRLVTLDRGLAKFPHTQCVIPLQGN